MTQRTELMRSDCFNKGNGLARRFFITVSRQPRSRIENSGKQRGVTVLGSMFGTKVISGDEGSYGRKLVTA